MATKRGTLTIPAKILPIIKLQRYQRQLKMISKREEEKLNEIYTPNKSIKCLHPADRQLKHNC